MPGTIRNSRPLKLAMKYFARGHIWVYQRTRGRLGAQLLWFPAALVTTMGRDADPAWYLNLETDPKAHVQIRCDHFDMVARDATAEERKHYWPKLIKLYPPYRGYREAADRPIPLVVCEP